MKVFLGIGGVLVLLLVSILFVFWNSFFDRAMAQGPLCPTLGLVAHWKFDEVSGTTALDSSGNGHTGNIIGNPAKVTGKIGGGFDFDGVDDAVQIPSSSAFDMSNITVSAWVYKQQADLPTHGNVIERQAGVGNNDSFTLAYDSDAADTYNWHTEAGVSGSVVVFGGPSTGDVDQWVHLLGSYDGATAKLYKNGVMVGSAASIPPGSNPLAVLCIGATTYDPSGPCDQEFANGIMDDVRIYNVALSDAEVVALYNDTGSCTVPIYTISGNIFVDANINRVKDGSEGNYSSGTVVTLSGAASRTTTSDASGNYIFSSLIDGNYTVDFTLPGGYTNTTPVSNSVTFP